MMWTNPVIGGENKLIRTAIQSPDFVAGVSGWSINKDGTAEFNNVTVRGEVDIKGSGNAELVLYNGFGVPTILFYQPDFGQVAPDTHKDPGSITGATITSTGPSPYASIDIKSPGWTTGGTEESLFRVCSQSYNGMRRASVEVGTVNGTGDNADFIVHGRALITDSSSNTTLTVNGETYVSSLLYVRGRDMGTGRVAYGGATGNSASVGNSNTTVLTSSSFTFQAGRAYQVQVAGKMATSAASMSPSAMVVSSAGTTLHTFGRISALISGQYAVPTPQAVFTVGASSVTRTVSFQINSNDAANTVIHAGPRWISVWDIGPATDWPDSLVMV